MYLLKLCSKRRKTVLIASVLACTSALLLWNVSQLLHHVNSSVALSVTTRDVEAPLSSSCDCGNNSNKEEDLLSFQQSYGFFDDIPDKDWIDLWQKPARNAQHYQYPQNPMRDANRAQFWNFFNFDPVFSCPHLRKVGGLGDGPKYVCDPERIRRVVERRKRERQGTSSGASAKKNDSDCLVYSVGSNGNFLFEDGLYNMLGPICEIHIFDFSSPSKLGLESKNMHFHKWGLTSSYSETYRNQLFALASKGTGMTTDLFSFQEIRQKLGHENRTLDIFKIDCEGCEWSTFRDWIGEDIRQILIETHELPLSYEERVTKSFGVLPKMSATEYFDAFEENGYVLYSKEINSPNWDQIGGRCSEWSYLKLHPDFLNMSSSSSSQATRLASSVMEGGAWQSTVTKINPSNLRVQVDAAKEDRLAQLFERRHRSEHVRGTTMSAAERIKAVTSEAQRSAIERERSQAS